VCGHKVMREVARARKKKMAISAKLEVAYRRRNRRASATRLGEMNPPSRKPPWTPPCAVCCACRSTTRSEADRVFRNAGDEVEPGRGSSNKTRCAPPTSTPDQTAAVERTAFTGSDARHA
jgi:hypothetical protein